MEAQQALIFRTAQSHIGQRLTVLIEGRLADEPEVYLGRSYMDAPEVDSYVFVTSPEELLSGSFVEAVVTDSKGYDLLAEQIITSEEADRTECL